MLLQSQMNQLSTDQLKAMAEAKRSKADSLKAELSSQADQVIEIVNDMRSKIVANAIGENNNRFGCLIGKVDQYLQTF